MGNFLRYIGVSIDTACHHRVTITMSYPGNITNYISPLFQWCQQACEQNSMAMRISFDFLVSGFTVGCSVSRDGFSLASLDNSLPPGISLPSFQTVTVSTIAVVFSTLGLRYWRALRYSAVSFMVPVPKQCSKEWKGEVLENPLIRVCGVPRLGQ